AILLPLARQSVAPSLAAKGIGYGMPGVLVDGNDLAALQQVLGDAVARARSGDGPTLVEADTYRMEAHTNADDATRYRTDDEVADWTGRDPLTRVRAYLTETGILDEQQDRQFAAEAEDMAAHIRAGIGAEAPIDTDDLFAHVYTIPTPQLVEQRAALRDELASEEA
ncbi:MAG: thiamine pyrophosphate-dependent enzyme, partial [Nakamurella sp.]